MHASDTQPRFTPLSPHIGSRVDGIDLAAPIDDATFARIRAELDARNGSESGI